MKPAVDPVAVRFGHGVFEDHVDEEFARARVTILTTRGTRARFLDDLIERHGLEPVDILDDCIENPTFDSCRCLHESIDFDRTTRLLAVGGGSVLDAAKAASLHDGAGGFDAVEDAIRSGSGVEAFETVPLVAVPTTAGTGSEVTPWGTIWDKAERRKYSVADDRLHPVRAYCDPDLTLTLPPATTLATALDALSHALESIWNKNASAETRRLALEAIELLLTHLEPLCRDPGNARERGCVMSAALKAGLAISKTRTSVGHALSYALTLSRGIPHGRACSFALPHILRVHLEQDSTSGLDATHLARLEAMFDALGVSSAPADYGISEAEFDAFFAAGTRSERMQNGTIDLDRLRAELWATYSGPKREEGSS